MAQITRLNEPIKIPQVLHNEQLTPADYDHITAYPFNALKNVLAVIFNGQSGKFEGLAVSVAPDDTGQYMISVGPGMGLVTQMVTDRKIEGTYIINVISKTVLCPLPVSPHVVSDKGVRMRVFLKHDIKKTDVEKRNFVREDGGIVTDAVPTTLEYTFGGGVDIVKPDEPIPDHDELTIGYITVQNQIITVEQVPDNPLTLYAHRTMPMMDHPDGSVHDKHLSPDLSGGYNELTDLSLADMSGFLQALKGSMQTPNDRVSGVIDMNGDAVDAAVSDAVEKLIQDYLSSITDGQGNLSKTAIDQLKDPQGRPAVNRIGVVWGAVSCASGTGSLPVPSGFNLADTFYIVSIGSITFKMMTSSTVTLECGEVTHGVATCRAHVQGTSYNVETFGTANFLGIAVTPRS